MKYILFLLGFIVFCLSCFAAKPVSSIQISAMLVDITHPKVLYADHADDRLMPGSATKLFVAVTALRQLGSQYQFTTPIYIRGTLSKGILQGDLI